jgi:Fic family protein
MKTFETLLKQYSELGLIQSKAEFDKVKIEFVYHSNRLEGSNLTIIQTQDIVNTHKASGEVSVIDSLMAIDNYRALNQALSFGASKYPLTEKILLSLHESLLKNSFELDPAYVSWKEKGQELGAYKIKANRILHVQNDVEVYYETPTPEQSQEMILKSLEAYNSSATPFIEKLSKLVQNVYNAHAFFDGNKRMTRLLIANQLLANGFPLVVLHNDKNAYNEALIDGFVNQTHQPIMNVLVTAFNQYLAQQIEEQKHTKKPKSKGFGLIL